MRCDECSGFIVELEPGVWLAEWSGDPGRTLARENAKRYAIYEDAVRGKARARRMRKFADAKIIPCGEFQPREKGGRKER